MWDSTRTDTKGMAPEADATPTEPDDAELMLRVQASDEPAFAILMHRWERPVKAVIARVVLNVSEAEELAQETFVRLWQHRGRFDPAKPVKPWILGIALNLARNRLRWWRRRPTLSLDAWTETNLPAVSDPGPEGGAIALEREERAAAVRDAIASLPVAFREALILFEYERMSCADIATTLATTPKTVENRIARARAALRPRLQRWA
mgnify:CR=1 FL=1